MICCSITTCNPLRQFINKNYFHNVSLYFCVCIHGRDELKCQYGKISPHTEMHSLYNIIIYTCIRYVNLTVHPSYTGTHKCKRIWSRRTGMIRHLQNLEFCVLPIKLLRLIKNGGRRRIWTHIPEGCLISSQVTYQFVKPSKCWYRLIRFVISYDLNLFGILYS